ncbi:hypothetical protein U1Q18_023605 [Sarracenia purpurea var. burkii]
MRIRRHAKLVGLLLSSSSSSTAAATSTDLSSPLRRHPSLICHLNQSPWDVLSFPPDSASSPFQVDGEEEDSFTANGSFGDSIGAVESVASMKISVEDGDHEKNAKNDAFCNIAENAEKVEEVEESEDHEPRRIGKGGAVLCCKSDGKGWQCKKEAAEGHSLCEHHLTQLRTYNSLSHLSGKKSDKAPSEKTSGIRRHPRPKKPSPASNPYEFYYYSGFGPRWGKKRGPKAELNSDANGAKYDIIEASPSQIDRDKFDYIDDDEYDDDDDDNIAGESGEAGKKRVRKPIKARSLKSLM